MNPLISYQGVDYYEAMVRTPDQIVAAANLFRNWFYTPTASVLVNSNKKKSRQPMDGKRGHGFAVYDMLQRWIGSPEYGVQQAWLLHSDEKPLTYEHMPDGSFTGPRHAYAFPERRYHALILLLANREFDDYGACISPASSLVSVEALCRDPWADASVCAAWASHRCTGLSDELEGVRELRITASEHDTEFQQALKSQGFFCSGPASNYPYSLPFLGTSTFDPDGVNRYEFYKILRLRGRLHQGDHVLYPKSMLKKKRD